MITIRSQNTLLHCMTDRFQRLLWFRHASTYGERKHWDEQMRRITAAAREIDPRYPAVVVKNALANTERKGKR